MNSPLKSMPAKSSFKSVGLFFLAGALVGGTVSAGVFLNQANKQAVSTAAVVGENLFKVDGVQYTSANLPGDSLMAYYQLQSSIYDAKLNFANQVALRLALAKDNPKVVGASADSLPALEALLVTPEVTDAEVETYYKSIVANYGPSVFGGKSLSELKAQLKPSLSRQKQDQTKNAKIQELTSGGRITTLLVKPEAPPVKLNLAGYPTRGNEKAAVTLVEVADYMCPHCRETEVAVEKIYKEFGNKVKFVQVSFPLNVEGLNGSLARGAFCANQQGREQFWNYHKNAFQVSFDKMQPTDAQSADSFFNNEAVMVATQSKLDMQAFGACLVSEDAKNYLTRLKTEFNAQNGFQGTPTFYLNNKLVQANPAQLEDTLRKALTEIAS